MTVRAGAGRTTPSTPWPAIGATPEERSHAVLVIASNATDADDLRHLLDIAGLGADEWTRQKTNETGDAR